MSEIGRLPGTEPIENTPPLESDKIGYRTQKICERGLLSRGSSAIQRFCTKSRCCDTMTQEARTATVKQTNCYGGSEVQNT